VVKKQAARKLRGVEPGSGACQSPLRGQRQTGRQLGGFDPIELVDQQGWSFTMSSSRGTGAIVLACEQLRPFTAQEGSSSLHISWRGGGAEWDQGGRIVLLQAGLTAISTGRRSGSASALADPISA